jgi:hypothetical protein
MDTEGSHQCHNFCGFLKNVKVSIVMSTDGGMIRHPVDVTQW